MRVNGYLENITENTKIPITSKGIKDKHKLTYHEKDTKNILKINSNQVILIRENEEFKNILIFTLDKNTVSSYLVKENNIELELNIKTTELTIKDNHINVVYTVIESNCEYEYNIEVSDEYEYKK